MEFKRIMMIAVSTILVLSLVACERPASMAPTATPTIGQAGFPLPGTSDNVMGQLQTFATQTFQALMGQSGTQVAGATPTQAISGVTTPGGVEPLVTQIAPTQAPATSTPIPVATSTPGIPQSYTLQKDEFPYCIARRFNLNPTELLNINGLSVNSTFYAGMALKIPQTGNHFPGQRALRTHPTNYTVVAGDTIYKIACLFGDADPNMIAAANNLTAPYRLTSGQILYIP